METCSVARSCGGCVVCCFTHEVEERLRKSAHTECIHASGGCGIYHVRPRACKCFACAWLHGYGSDEEWPHLSGIVPRLLIENGLDTLVMTEARPNALENSMARKTTREALARGLVVLHVLMDDSQIRLIPPGLDYPAYDIAQDHGYGIVVRYAEPAEFD